MPLRFDLGPFEELHMGTCVIKNSHQRSLFIVEGDMPILQGKDVLAEQAVSNPVERLYHCIQQMYLERASDKYQGKYLQSTAQAMSADPTIHEALQMVDSLIRKGNFYKALKSLKQFIRPDAFVVKQRPSATYSPRANGWKPNRLPRMADASEA